MTKRPSLKRRALMRVFRLAGVVGSVAGGGAIVGGAILGGVLSLPIWLPALVVADWARQQQPPHEWDS
jgi:hypothetical protein